MWSYFIFITPCKNHLASMNGMSNKSIDLHFLAVKAAIMAAKHEEWVVTALKSLSSIGLILPKKTEKI